MPNYYMYVYCASIEEIEESKVSERRLNQVAGGGNPNRVAHYSVYQSLQAENIVLEISTAMYHHALCLILDYQK